LNNLALLYSAQNRMADAEPLAKRAVTIYERAPGASRVAVANALRTHASILESVGRGEEAKQVQERASRLMASSR